MTVGFFLAIGLMSALAAEMDALDKPEDMKAKILEGKIAGYFKEQTLLDQSFFKAPEKTIEQYAKEHGASVVKFVTYTV
jgi:elongation factor Ts